MTTYGDVMPTAGSTNPAYWAKMQPYNTTNGVMFEGRKRRITNYDDGPLIESGMVSRTYVGDMDGQTNLGSMVRRFRERGTQDRFGPHVVVVHAREWTNGFHKQWVAGQPMFSIESQIDKDHIIDNRRRVGENVIGSSPSGEPLADEDVSAYGRSSRANPTTIISGPQLMALLEEASKSIADVVNTTVPQIVEPTSTLPQVPGGSGTGMGRGSGSGRGRGTGSRRGRGTPTPTSTLTSPTPTTTTATTVSLPPTRTPAIVSVIPSTEPIKTAGNIIRESSEQIWYNNPDQWRKVMGNNNIGAFGNIEYIRRYVKYIGILVDEPETSQDGVVALGIGVSGNVRCPAYWGEDANPGDSVGFIVKRLPQTKQAIRSYIIRPWLGKISMVPKKDELIFEDHSRNQCDGVFFYVGKIVFVSACKDRSIRTQKVTALETDDQNLRMLGRYTTSNEQINTNSAYLETRTAHKDYVICVDKKNWIEQWILRREMYDEKNK